MASFWSDTLVNFINNTTGQNGGNGIVSVATESVGARAVEHGYGFNINLHETGLTTGSSTYFLCQTPATGLITDALAYASCVDNSTFQTGNMLIEFFEDSVTTADGDSTGVIVANFNRNSAIIPNFTITHAPTVTADGTQLVYRLISSLASGGWDVTYQLKPSTKYLVKLTNVGNATIDYSVSLTWFQLS